LRRIDMFQSYLMDILVIPCVAMKFAETGRYVQRQNVRVEA
jgi:hypothetical protein